MKVLKSMVAVFAYIGLAIVVLGVVGISWTAISYLESSAYSWSIPTVHEWDGIPMIIGVFISIPGLVLALIGGIIARPHNFWPLILAAGAFFCIFIFIAFISRFVKAHDESILILILELFVFSLPGLICIIGGVIIRWLMKKQHLTSNSQDLI